MDTSGLLSSDILERQFGPTTLEVLRQDSSRRIIATKTIRDGRVLELSHVIFKDPGAAAFPAIHREIVAGESMGKAFAGHGIAFERQVHTTHGYDLQSLPDSFAKRFGESGTATVVDVSVLVGPDRVPYADILEVYAPAVSWPPVGKPDPAIPGRISAFGTLLME